MPSMPPREWTHDADEALRAAMRDCEGLASWPEVVHAAFPDGGHSVSECIERWKQLNKPMNIKGPWAIDEDRQLVALVAELSTNKWTDVARRLGTRTGKQCRERWHNHLDPSIDKRPFTPGEDAIILQLYDTIGAKWAEISRHLHGRPDNAIKNHFNTTLTRIRTRRESISSTTTTSTSRSSDSPGPASSRRNKMNGSLSEPSAPSSPRFTPYTRPRAGTDALLPSPGIVSSRHLPREPPQSPGGTILTRSQSSADVPSARRRSLRTSLQMTPARSMEAPLHLKLTAQEMAMDGFYPSGPATAPILSSAYASPSRLSDMFDTWSTPPATPDASVHRRDYYFADPIGRSLPGHPSSITSPASTLQAALDDLVLSPGSTGASRSASLMSRFASTNSMPPSPQSPVLTRSMSYGGVPPSSLAMYDAGLTAHKARPMMDSMLRMGSIPSPGMVTDYGSSSGHSILSDALPITPPQSAPSSCSASSHSLSSYPFDHYSTDPISRMMGHMSEIPTFDPDSRDLIAAPHAAHHTYSLRSSTRDVRDTPSPAKSDLTV